MSSTAELLNEIEQAYPFVEKPKGLAISFHKVGCLRCEFIRRDLEPFSGQELPLEGLTEIYRDMGCLSAAGWRWALPSYLRYCVSVDDTYDGTRTEFLIYALGPALKHQKETMEQLKCLNTAQVDCLVHFLEWLSVHPHWSEYCPEDIERALVFMRVYGHNNSLQGRRP